MNRVYFESFIYEDNTSLAKGLQELDNLILRLDLANRRFVQSH
jgi:hypothetical protein